MWGSGGIIFENVDDDDDVDDNVADDDGEDDEVEDCRRMMRCRV